MSIGLEFNQGQQAMALGALINFRHALVIQKQPSLEVLPSEKI
jgi:hypothetical protein